MWLSQLRKGLVQFAVLLLLRGREAYGYQILEELSQCAALEVTESTLYRCWPGWHGMERCRSGWRRRRMGRPGAITA